MNETRLRIAWGGIFVLLGLVYLFFIGMSGGVDCTRLQAGEISCTVTRSWMSIVPYQRIPAEALQGVQIQDRRGGRSSGYTYRVVISTPDGTIALLPLYSGNPEPKRTAAAQIEAFLADSTQESVRVRMFLTTGLAWLSILIPAALLGMGGRMIIGGMGD